MYNCLLKIHLGEGDIFSPLFEDIANTSVIVKVADAFKVFDKFFGCFDMPLEHCTGTRRFTTWCEVAPVTEFDEFSQLAEELDENNPFQMDWYEVSDVWNVVNDWKYKGVTA